MDKTLEDISTEWLAAYKTAIESCPKEFIDQLTRFAFLGAGLMSEAWIGGAGSATNGTHKFINDLFLD